MDEERVLSFIRSAIKSAWSLELLLLLQRDPRRAWPVAAIVRELRASEPSVRESVATLAAAGLVESDGSEVHYAPSSNEMDELVMALVALYAQKPIMVLRTIFTSPSEKIRSFADAFRFRKDGPR